MPDALRLGRSVVVGPGQPPPPQWSDCERRAVDSVNAELAGELHSAWLERRPLVLELAPGIGLDDPAVPPPERVTGLQPWDWPVDMDLVGERLHHAVWANSVDARQPDRPRWRWAEEARRLGAGPPDGATTSAGTRRGLTQPDVMLPDGRPAVCDGGPLDASLATGEPMALLHRTSIEHGSLNPLGTAFPAPPGPLAADQMAAVVEPRAGARVIAPAGSGKTRVLTERARLLIGGWGLPPAALALVAYNVRAAGEMRDRLADVPALRIRTLNALGLRLCGRSSTIDEGEVRRILSGLVSFPRRAETDPAAPWIEALSRVRLGLAAPEEVEDELGDVSDLDGVARAFRGQLAERDVVDFDEQVTGAIERLLADPHFRARSQRFARVLLVDEFQDLTPAHLLLIRLLSGPAGAVFGVGDDDQTIYGYAGATPRWLVDFSTWFPGSAAHSLEVNYRCPPAVVAAASNLLSRNAVRVVKTIRPAADVPTAPATDPAAHPSTRPDAGPAPGLEVLDPDGRGPATRTAERVERLLSEGASPADIAVLSRVNASLVPVHVLLGYRGVPVDSTGDRRFLQRGGVRGAMAWLEVAAAPADRLPGAALREAARRPKRGMGNGLLDLLARPRKLDSLEGLSAWLEGKGSTRDADKVDTFARDVALVRKAASKGTAQVLRVVRRQVGGGGLDASATALDQWSHGAIAAHLDDLDALSELAELEPDPARFPAWLADRLAAAPTAGGVTLASIHAVKGREWPHVIIHHATEGLLPHRLSPDEEEERRIFHVGLTRASVSASVVPGSPPSSFIRELDRPGQPGELSTKPPTPAGAGRAAAPKAAGGGGQIRGPRKPDRGPAGDLLPAVPGLVFSSGGQEHEVVEVAAEAALCLLGGGPARTAIRYGTPVTHAGATSVLAHPAAPAAFERLKAWRGDKARSLNVPAYVVFDDSTLRLLATHLPVTEAGLLSVRGIGPAKLESYGSELIGLTEELRAVARD
ncbi:MAG TPA: ATP-dependent DNA helicase UvrD2 [Acidimicrobiales bacterium]|nr:ATP-dependent DNA helicase UvrD2 [Acidimicrobiales bacterium]